MQIREDFEALLKDVQHLQGIPLANGEGALLPKLLIFFRYGQADAEKRSGACLAPNLGFIRMATGVRLGNHARAAWR